jgi:hypothetical protein
VAPHRPYVKCSKCRQDCATKSGICEECSPSRKKERFLKAFALHGTVGVACQACKLAPSTLYRWLKKDDAFLERYLDEQRIHRDKFIDLLCCAAVGKGEMVTEYFRENGHPATRDVPRQMPVLQLRAILNVLRATDHVGGPAEMFVFTDKRRETQYDLADKPKQIQWIEIHDAQPRID